MHLTSASLLKYVCPLELICSLNEPNNLQGGRDGREGRKSDEVKEEKDRGSGRGDENGVDRRDGTE